MELLDEVNDFQVISNLSNISIIISQEKTEEYNNRKSDNNKLFSLIKDDVEKNEKDNSSKIIPGGKKM